MDAFIDFQKRNSVKVIFPNYQFNISQNNHGLQTTQKFNIIVEKIDALHLMQIRLNDVCNQSKIFICTIDVQMYESIRSEQSLNVSFQGFLDHLIKILECCKKEELFMTLVKEDNIHILQFYEKRSFKNLTHLFLVMTEAPHEAILYHINQTLSICQEQIHAFSNQTISLQREINTRDSNITELRHEINSLKAKLNEQENLIFSRNTEAVSRLQQTIKHISEAKETEEKRLKGIINEQQATVDCLVREKYALNEKLAQETHKSEVAQEETNRMRTKHINLKDDNSKLLKDISQYQSRDERNESVIIGLRKQIIELQTQMKGMEKQQSGLKAELDAERNICHTKKQALEIATQDLAGYNELIGRQNKEIVVLREKVKTRTEVAINQEQFVKRIEKENADLNGRLRAIFSEHAEQRKQIEDMGKVLANVQQCTGQMEQKYQKKINELQSQIAEIIIAPKNGYPQKSQKVSHPPLRLSNHQPHF